MITTEFTPYDSLLVNLDEDGKPMSFNSDISLFKRNEVLNMLPKSVDSLFDASSQSNPYTDMSDDDIMENTKSRRIQSPSELKSWSDSLKYLADFKTSRYKQSLSSKRSVSKSVETVKSVDTNKSDS